MVEVKKDDFDLNAAIVQGMSYVDWMQRHRRHLFTKVKDIGWNVDLDTVKLYVIAPGDGRQSVDCVDCNVRVVLINQDWYVDEKVNVIH